MARFAPRGGAPRAFAPRAGALDPTLTEGAGPSGPTLAASLEAFAPATAEDAGTAARDRSGATARTGAIGVAAAIVAWVTAGGGAQRSSAENLPVLKSSSKS